MDRVGQQHGGKRRGARKGARPPRSVGRGAFLTALATTIAVIAWGYLVYAAIDFGSDARAGDARAWGFLALAAVGAAACLFAALLLGARMMKALGASGQARTPGTEGISPGSAGSGRPPGSHQKDR